MANHEQSNNTNVLRKSQRAREVVREVAGNHGLTSNEAIDGLIDVYFQGFRDGMDAQAEFLFVEIK